MNEKIQKLAEQANLEIDPAYPDHNQKVLEKLVELIVSQCINIACNYDKPKLSGPGHAIASYMEAHFDIYIGEDGRLVK